LIIVIFLIHQTIYYIYTPNNQDMRFSIILLFAFISVFSLTACQKEMSSETGHSSNPANGAGSMKAKINSTQWSSDKFAAAYRLVGLISITGVDNNKRYISFTLVDSGVHKYVLSDETINYAVLLDSSESNKNAYSTNQGNYPSESGGEVNVTSIDENKKTISGTFSFKVFREEDGAQKTITEGSFTNLTYATSMPQASVTDTFRVKIDGSSWAPHFITGVSALGQISISASNSSATKSVGLTFPSNIQPGTYTLDFFGATYIGQYNPDLDPNHSKASVSGTLTILEHNTSQKRVRGNFAFRGEEMLNQANFAELTDGYFSVKYQ
jgi:hypothetical protein